MTAKRKVLIVLTSDLFVRNYIVTNSLALLRAAFDVCLVSTTEVTMQESMTASGCRHLGAVKLNPTANALHYILLNVMMWRNRAKSSSFIFRLRRQLLGDRILSFDGWLDGLRFVCRCLYFNLLVPRTSALLAMVCSVRPFVDMLQALCRRVRPSGGRMRHIVAEQKPDLLVFPCSAYDPLGQELTDLGSTLHVTTLFLVDNWDNLSSKTVYSRRPDFIAVWGPQSAEHATRIHGFSPRRVVEIGTPRFDAYYASRDRPLPSHFAHPYVLFVGCAIPFNEHAVILRLDRALHERSERLPRGLRVVYRPHPWRHPRHAEASLDYPALNCTVLDPQIASQLDHGKLGSVAFQPGLHYYPSLLRNAALVVGPLTTMLLEAMICRRRVIGLTFSDGVHYTSPDNAYRYYEHFRGIERLPLLQLCDREDDLAERIVAALSDPAPGVDCDSSLDWFLHRDARPYGARLMDAVELAITDGNVASAAR